MEDYIRKKDEFGITTDRVLKNNGGSIVCRICAENMIPFDDYAKFDCVCGNSYDLGSAEFDIDKIPIPSDFELREKLRAKGVQIPEDNGLEIKIDGI